MCVGVVRVAASLWESELCHACPYVVEDGGCESWMRERGPRSLEEKKMGEGKRHLSSLDIFSVNAVRLPASSPLPSSPLLSQSQQVLSISMSFFSHNNSSTDRKEQTPAAFVTNSTISV